MQYFEKNLNINGIGAVIASPDPIFFYNNANYGYDWVRDGALSMESYM